MRSCNQRPIHPPGTSCPAPSFCRRARRRSRFDSSATWRHQAFDRFPQVAEWMRPRVSIVGNWRGVGCFPSVVGRSIWQEKSLPGWWEASIFSNFAYSIRLSGSLSSRTPTAPYWERNKYEANNGQAGHRHDQGFVPVSDRSERRHVSPLTAYGEPEWVVNTGFPGRLNGHLNSMTLLRRSRPRRRTVGGARSAQDKRGLPYPSGSHTWGSAAARLPLPLRRQR